MLLVGIALALESSSADGGTCESLACRVLHRRPALSPPPVPCRRPAPSPPSRNKMVHAFWPGAAWLSRREDLHRYNLHH